MSTQGFNRIAFADFSGQISTLNQATEGKKFDVLARGGRVQVTQLSWIGRAVAWLRGDLSEKKIVRTAKRILNGIDYKSIPADHLRNLSKNIYSLNLTGLSDEITKIHTEINSRREEPRRAAF